MECGVEEIFIEPVNPRGPGLRKTQEALARAGYTTEALAVEAIRNRKIWAVCVQRLISTVQGSVRKHSEIDRLRLLLYPSNLTRACEEKIREDDAGVIWLDKK